MTETNEDAVAGGTRRSQQALARRVWDAADLVRRGGKYHYRDPSAAAPAADAAAGGDSRTSAVR